MHIRRFYVRLITAALVFGLTACAVAPPPVTSNDYGDFQRSGRFALSVQNADGSQEAVQGGFLWYETAQQLQVDLNNPMGTVLARVTVSPQGALLLYPNGEQRWADSADALVELLLGHAIPIEGMRNWLHGQAGPSPVIALEQQNDQLSSFQQDNWRVRLQRYDELGPRLLQMNRNQAQQTISVRLIVDY